MDLPLDLLNKLASRDITKEEFIKLLNSPAFKKAKTEFIAKSSPQVRELYETKITEAIDREDYRGVIATISNGLPKEQQLQVQKALISADFAGQTAKDLIKKTAKDIAGTLPYPVGVELDNLNIDRLVEVYKKAVEDIASDFASASDFSKQRKIKLLNQIKGRLDALGEETDLWLRNNLPEYYLQGANDILHQLKTMGAGIKSGFEFDKVNEQVVINLIDDTSRSFGEAISGMYRNVNQILSEATKLEMRQRIASGSVTGAELRKIKQTIVGKLQEEGFDVLKDKAGHKWTLDRYAEMLTRTKMVEARNTGSANKMLENGYDLVQITQHSNTCEQCAEWEGEILSISGNTPGYKTLAEAEMGGLFHPNCRHAANTIIPEIAERTSAYHTSKDDDFEPPFKDNKPAKEVGVKWKPYLPDSEASKYIKDSKVQDTLYHGTDKKSAAIIKKEGFDTNKVQEELTRFADGFYFTDDQGLARAYASATSEPLKVKLNVNKMKEFTNEEFKELQLQYRMQFAKRDDAIKAMSDQLKSKYDAVKITNPSGGSDYVVFRKESIIVTD